MDCTVFPTGLPFPPVKGNIFPGCRGSLTVSKTEGPLILGLQLKYMRLNTIKSCKTLF